MSMYLHEAYAECVSQLGTLGIPIGNVKEVAINRRAKKRWGQCCLKPDGFYININAVLCDGKHDDGLRSTLMHELLHTCPNCFNHGAKWKAYAEQIKTILGINILTTDTYADKGFTAEEWNRIAPKPKPKYRFRCKKCGHIVERTKETMFTRNYQLYYCGKCCKGKFELISPWSATNTAGAGLAG